MRNSNRCLSSTFQMLSDFCKRHLWNPNTENQSQTFLGACTQQADVAPRVCMANFTWEVRLKTCCLTASIVPSLSLRRWEAYSCVSTCMSKHADTPLEMWQRVNGSAGNKRSRQRQPVKLPSCVSFGESSSWVLLGASQASYIDWL